MTGSHRPAGGCERRSACGVTPESPAGRTRPARPRPGRRRGARRSTPATDELLVLPLAGGVHGHVRRRGVRARRPAATSSTGPATSPTCRATPSVTIASDGGGRFALPSARCERAAARSATSRPTPCRSSCAAPGQRSRQVNNFCTPDAFDADRSSPARCSRPAATGRRTRRTSTTRQRDGETELEEIYYFEVADGPRRGPGMAYQRVYGTPAAADRRARRGPHRRRRAGPARLARPVDGGARLRPLLPQRDGRARRPSAPG